MTILGKLLRRWWYRRTHGAVSTGWGTVAQAGKSADVPRMAVGLAVMVYGAVRRRSTPRLIYKTSIDAGQGTTIVVKRGRRPVAETAPLP